MTLKKILPITTASLLSITSFLQADACAPCCPEVKPIGACKKPFVPATNPCSLGSINPSAEPRLNCARASVTLEGLLWTANLDGLQFAIQNSESSSLASSGVSINNSSAYYDAQLLHPKSQWDYGFRFGLGYVLSHDGWDLQANWTHLRNIANQHVEIDLQFIPDRLYILYSAIVPGPENSKGVSDLSLTPPMLTNPTADNVHARWKLHLELFDLELGREFYTSRYLTLRPHLGLRGVSIRQKYDIDYQGGAFTEMGIVLVDDVDFKNNFWGIGPRGGLNSLWHWSRNCCGDWSFYGNLALSLIYGRFEIEQNENVENTNGIVTNSDLNVLSIQNDFRATRALTDLALGIRFDRDYKDTNTHFALWLGWEQHIAFNMNQWVYYNSFPSTAGHASPTSPSTYTTYSPQEGDLTTQGWTLGLEIDF